ncbi:MAG: hypothetical protein DYH05_07255 [Acidobacteria bacterium ACB1]|nr:hypothetical protein [Acidobacteria bacterium ACB1]RIJ90881.1 MAG: hypothetical protein DCC44_10125 [Acidobacteriota bacterium]
MFLTVIRDAPLTGGQMALLYASDPVILIKKNSRRRRIAFSFFKTMATFEERLNSLDLTLFENIQSQTTEDDRRSLLAIQCAVRERSPGYNYLEIGSHLGGSLQSHLLDDKCSTIYSIDKRPLVQPDERGVRYGYPENSTARMLELLSELAPTEKIITIDGDTKTLDPNVIDEKIQLCFIDGEHTDVATSLDFEFCLDVLDGAGGGSFFTTPM